ncbi:hypothetical protein F4678DRAFT_483996 [Xylaria arbuscula]|nr:hypothetical protein F4678DRAFT_483996 [Xylaria arbuscula]
MRVSRIPSMDSQAQFSDARASPLEDPLIKRPMSHGWRPEYLRRRVIVIFIIVFILSIIALEALNVSSLQQKGLTSSTQSSLYLWTLGPTTVITIILVFWSRVEYQASRYMPWIILARPIRKEIATDLQFHDGHRTIFLDYPNMSPPKAVWTAIKNKHWLVLVSILSSTILRIQIILSSGLFSIELIPFQLEIPVSLIDHISDKLPNQHNDLFRDYRVYRTDQAILGVGLQYPNFTSPGTLLQQFDIPKVLKTTTNISDFTVIVDGLSSAFTCDLPHVNISISNNQLEYDVNSTSLNHSSTNSFDITDIAQSNGHFLIYSWEDSSKNNSITPYFLAAMISSAWIRDTNATRYEGSAALCEMHWTITPTSARYKNGALSTTAVAGAKSKIITGPLFDFLSKTQIPFIQGIPQYIPLEVSPSGVDIMFTPKSYTENDLLVPFAVGTRLLFGNETGLGHLMNATILKEAMLQYHLQHDILAAHLNLRVPTQRVVNGTASQNLERLVVQTPICQVLAGLFGLLIILLVPLLWHTAPRDGFLPREPTTLAGLVAILSRSRLMMSALTYHGHVDMPSILMNLQGAYYTAVVHRPSNPLFPEFQIRKMDEDMPLLDCDSLLQDSDESDGGEPDMSWYQPWTLHPISRGVASVVLLGMTVTLGALFGVSSRSDGIGTVPNDGLLHYSWTLVPSALFVIANLYLGSCDFEIRNLASFVALKSEVSSFSGLFSSFPDQIGIRTLFNAIKACCSVVAGSKLIVLLGTLLPIFTANLFSPETVQLSRRVTLQQDEWIASSNSGYDTSNLAAGTILATNLSYPAWTYGDLVFPRVSLANADTLEVDDTVTANIWAVRPVLTCKASMGTSSFEFGLDGRQYTCPVSSIGFCGFDDQPFGFELDIIPLNCSDDTGRTNIDMLTGIPITAYTWGSCASNYTSSGLIKYTTVLICDESFEEVEVTTMLFGPNLEIHDSHPPQPNEATAKPFVLQVNDTGYYDFAFGATAEKSADLGFFPALTTSRDGVPDAWFQNDTHLGNMIAAIKNQHGILRAQGISGGLGARRRFDNDTEDPAFVSMTAPKRPADIVGEHQYVSHRVIQHPVSSSVLLGLLASISILLIFTTYQSEREGYRRAVPKPPGSIAAIASLIADSDIPQHLPVDVQWMTDRKLKAHFQGRQFRMGWFEQRDGDSLKKVYTIREMRDTNPGA